jgi:integrase
MNYGRRDGCPAQLGLDRPPPLIRDGDRAVLVHGDNPPPYAAADGDDDPNAKRFCAAQWNSEPGATLEKPRLLPQPGGWPQMRLLRVIAMKNTITTSLTTHEFVFIQSRTFGRKTVARSRKASRISAGVARKSNVSAMNGRQCHQGSPWAARYEPTAAEVRMSVGKTPRRRNPFFALLTHTGIRIGEALGLRWESVHLGDDPYIDVREQVYRGERKQRPKSHHGIRRLPLSPGMALALDRHRRASEFDAPSAPVFTSQTGTAIDYSALRRRVLLPAIEASAIEWPKGTAFHMFRKTAASLIHGSGKTGRQLADWLGHGDPSFSIRTYVGQMDEGLGDASFLDELVPVDGQRLGNATPGDSRKPEDAGDGESAANQAAAVAGRKP